MKGMKTDRPVPSGVPKGFRGQDQLDGTKTTQFSPPMRQAPLQDRESSPANSSESGVERAMRSLAE